jgi:hypothetical protein
MIKLTETKNIYSIIWEDEPYNLVHVYYPDTPEDDYVEIYDNKGNIVDNDTWNKLVSYWELITEQ